MAVWKDDKVATEILSGRTVIPRTNYKFYALLILAIAVSGGAVFAVIYRRPKNLAAASRQIAADKPVEPAKAATPAVVVAPTVAPVAAPAPQSVEAAKIEPAIRAPFVEKTPAKPAAKPANSIGIFVDPDKGGKFGKVYAALYASKADAALESLKSIAPAAGSPESKEALVLEGRALLAQGKIEDARKKFEPLAFAGADSEIGTDALFGNFYCQAGVLMRCRDSELEQVRVGVNSWGAASAAFELARRADQSAGEDLAAQEKARALYQQALDSGKLDQTEEAKCLARLTELTNKIVLDSKTACTAPKAVFHKVDQGDGVERIAKKYKVNQGQLKVLNKLNDKLIVRNGQTLKMLPGDVLYKVNRTKLTGTLYIDGVFIRRYPVGIGPGNATPVGEYVVERKTTNPDWYYDGKRIPFGDAQNILGTRWMAFAGTDTHGAGLGIHGTSLPDSVPGRESKGCVRMHNPDVEELYDLMPQGGKVEIAD
jgi:hypothetical protein